MESPSERRTGVRAAKHVYQILLFNAGLHGCESVIHWSVWKQGSSSNEVQALRYDAASFVEHFILRAGKSSQLFAHQIIWNMNANMFKLYKEKGEEKQSPDTLKDSLDRISGNIVASLSGSDKEFYEREFSFFAEVTGISGKLKPYISKSKAEKK
ncbi:phosphatidylinositol-4- kinase, partial [Blyttiomyces sp. JEL0837]